MSPGARQKSCCCILDRLQTPKQVVRDTIKQGVAVIEPTGYKRLPWPLLQEEVLWPPVATDEAGYNSQTDRAQ